MTTAEPLARAGRLAVVDCGSNSTRLLIAQVRAGGVRPLLRRTVITRLGGQVERTGRLADAAVRRVVAVIDDFAGQWRSAGVDRVAVCATSAVRDAANARHFADGVTRVTGVAPVVLSGAEEAELTFAGAVASTTGRQVVCDVGGGSTELIVGVGTPLHRVSLQLGSVRLRERHLQHDPPTADEYAALLADIDGVLRRQPAVYTAEGDVPLVAVAGTATTLAGVTAGVGPDELDRVDGMVLSRRELDQVIEDLAWLPARDRLRHPAIVPGREDVVVTGAMLLARVLARFGFRSLRVRVADLLDGVALRLAAGGWPPGVGMVHR